MENEELPSSRDRTYQSNVSQYSSVQSKTRSFDISRYRSSISNIHLRDLDIPMLRSISSEHDVLHEATTWLPKNSVYISKIDKVKQIELNRNKLAFMIYRPIPSIIICLVIGALLLGIAGTMYMFGKPTDKIYINYTTSDTKPIRFTVTKTLRAPIYLYHSIENFYASHKIYGHDSVHYIFTKNRCLAVKTFGELLQTRCIDGVNTLYVGKEWNDVCRLAKRKDLEILNKEIYPCGISSATMMTDNFEICKDGSGSNCYMQTMPVETKNGDLFKTLFNYGKERFVWIDPSNVRLRLWNNMPFGPNFQVLYGIIEEDMPPGHYYLNVTTNTWPSSKWRASKGVVLATTTIFGDKGTPFIIILVAVGFLYILTGILFAIFQLRCCCEPDDVNFIPLDSNIPKHVEDVVNEAEVEEENDYEPDPELQTMPCLCPLH